MTRMAMNKRSLSCATFAAVVLAAAPVSLHWSPTRTLSLSLDKADARVGRPLSPGSIAGVNRRVNRRTARRAYYGGAAAIGAAGAYYGAAGSNYGYGYGYSPGVSAATQDYSTQDYSNQDYSADDSNSYNGTAGSYAAGAGGYGQQPLYNMVTPEGQPGVTCVGGSAIGTYPNPVASGSSADSISSGAEFMVDRGYFGCFESTDE